MPHSLRARLNNLRYKGMITDKDYQRLCNALDYEKQQKGGVWLDHSEDGYVECPFCRYPTTCNNDISELHYCFNCGAKMQEE